MQPAGPPFCAARQSAENSCFSIGNMALQPARPAGPPFSVIRLHHWDWVDCLSLLSVGFFILLARNTSTLSVVCANLGYSYNHQCK